MKFPRLRTRSTRASTRSSTPRAVSTSSRSATRADLSIQLRTNGRALRGRLFFPNANPTGVWMDGTLRSWDNAFADPGRSTACVWLPVVYDFCLAPGKCCCAIMT
ncbi:exported hypothetical protein [Stenotrophomonas thermophila]|nr:exported hypothetical protein [Stenotrophomonas maltophilia]